MKTRRQFSPEYKAKAALEAIKGQRTLNEIAGDLEVDLGRGDQWTGMPMQNSSY